MKINNADELSRFVRDQRKRQSRTQGDVSTNIGIQQQTVSAFERNAQNSKIDTLFRLINEIGLELHLTPAAEDDQSAATWSEEW